MVWITAKFTTAVKLLDLVVTKLRQIGINVPDCQQWNTKTGITDERYVTMSGYTLHFFPKTGTLRFQNIDKRELTKEQKKSVPKELEKIQEVPDFFVPDKKKKKKKSNTEKPTEKKRTKKKQRLHHLTPIASLPSAPLPSPATNISLLTSEIPKPLYFSDEMSDRMEVDPSNNPGLVDTGESDDEIDSDSEEEEETEKKRKKKVIHGEKRCLKKEKLL